MNRKHWPLWWKDVKEVKEIIKGDEEGIGSMRTYTLISPLGYKLSFNLLLTERTEYQLLKGEASGDLKGTGAWHFTSSADICFVECHWKVATTIPWMNFMGFFLRPVFQYNHSLVMKSGARCLARKLNAVLISC